MDQSLCVLSAMHGRGVCGSVLDHRSGNNDSGGEQFGADIPDHDWHTCLPAHRECWPSPHEETPQQDLQGV